MLYPTNTKALREIRRLMKELGINQSALSPYFGGAPKVSEVFNGKRKLSLRMIKKLHKGLGIPLEILMEGK